MVDSSGLWAAGGATGDRAGLWERFITDGYLLVRGLLKPHIVQAAHTRLNDLLKELRGG
jgi:hypothetical protein